MQNLSSKKLLQSANNTTTEQCQSKLNEDNKIVEAKLQIKNASDKELANFMCDFAEINTMFNEQINTRFLSGRTIEQTKFYLLSISCRVKAKIANKNSEITQSNFEEIYIILNEILEDISAMDNKIKYLEAVNLSLGIAKILFNLQVRKDAKTLMLNKKLIDNIMSNILNIVESVKNSTDAKTEIKITLIDFLADNYLLNNFFTEELIDVLMSITAKNKVSDLKLMLLKIKNNNQF